MLNRKSPIPLYHQLKSHIEHQINKGVWKPKDQIPTELELIKQFQVSRVTVRQAVRELVVEGKLESLPGKGTFVTEKRIDKLIFSHCSFTQDVKSRGLEPNSKILIFKKIIPTNVVMQILNQKESEHVILLKRQRLANNQVLALETTFLPFYRFRNLLNEDLENLSLYETLEKKYKTLPKYINQLVESLRCPSSSADLLEIDVGSPILRVKSTCFDQFDQPFEYTDGYYRGDRYSLNFRISNELNIK